jgi:hypothetical protein
MQSDIVKSVVTLLMRARRPPGEEIPAGAKQEDISAFEAAVGFQLPDETRLWLKTSNAPNVGPGGLFGIGRVPKHLSMEYCLHLYPTWRREKWLPIASDGCGNYYIQLVGRESQHAAPVCFVEPISDAEHPAYLVASSLWLFLQFLLSKELGESLWPFDRRFVVRRDPEIVSVGGAPLPWDA